MNPQRGEVAILIDGEPRKLCLTLGALAEIEAALGCESLKDLTIRLKTISARDMIRLLAALLRGGGEDLIADTLATRIVQPGEAMAAILASFGKAIP